MASPACGAEVSAGEALYLSARDAAMVGEFQESLELVGEAAKAFNESGDLADWEGELRALETQIGARAHTKEQAGKHMRDARAAKAAGADEKAYMMASMAAEMYSKINYAPGQRQAIELMQDIRYEIDKAHYREVIEPGPEPEPESQSMLPLLGGLLIACSLMVLLIKSMMSSIPEKERASQRKSGRDPADADPSEKEGGNG